MFYCMFYFTCDRSLTNERTNQYTRCLKFVYEATPVILFDGRMLKVHVQLVCFSPMVISRGGALGNPFPLLITLKMGLS